MKFPIVILAGLLVSCAPAHAQSMCAPYDSLRDTFEEQGIRLEGGNGEIELWVAYNEEWAIIAINPQGIACLMASGENWTIPERL
jgi:hypothetical protein